MAEKLDKYVLSNGMVVLGEPMADVGSVAFDMLLPCGSAAMPKSCGGAAEVISDWIFRGAGERESRELVDALDSLGLHRGASVNSPHMSVGAALEAENLGAALELFADIVLRPLFKDDQFELSKQLAIQDLLGLDDDPRQKVMLKLQEIFYPDPLGANPMGTVEELEALSAQRAREIAKTNFNIPVTIFGVAGKYDFQRVCGQLETLFGKEPAQKQAQISPGTSKRGYVHQQHDGAQIHIGLMTPSVTVDNQDYYNARLAVSVLSGGMSSRLFTEVREKRGLCYAVGAQYSNLKQMAGISCYAGSAPEKAQETLDVIIAEFRRLAEGISEDELNRAKVGLKSSLVMQSESSGARSSGIANDYYLLGRVRGIEEIKTKIDQTTVESVLEYLRKNPFEEFTVVTIGPKELTVKV